MTEQGLFATPAAAKYLDTTERRIHELRRAGVLGAVKEGRQFKFTRAELDHYIDQLTKHHSYEPGQAS